MISGNNIVIRKGSPDDISEIKKIVDRHRKELGFVYRSALLLSISRGELLAAVDQKNVVLGIVHYRHRLDRNTTLYNLVVTPGFQGFGIGKELIQALILESQKKGQQSIILKCPEDLPSNEFYRGCGFEKITTEQGKKRPLNIWSLDMNSMVIDKTSSDTH
jgi:N-acetylglutamate synthase-like GNAT family acetyltransferase